MVKSQDVLYMLENMYMNRMIRENHKSTIHEFNFNATPNCHNMIATVGKNQVNILDNQHLGEYLDLVSHYVHPGKQSNYFWRVCWVSGSMIAAGDKTGNILIVSFAANAVKGVYKGHKGEAILSLDSRYLSTTEYYLLSQSQSKVVVWNVAEQTPFQSHDLADVNCACFGASHDQIIYCNSKGQVFLVSPDLSQPKLIFTNSHGPIEQLKYIGSNSWIGKSKSRLLRFHYSTKLQHLELQSEVRLVKPMDCRFDVLCTDDGSTDCYVPLGGSSNDLHVYCLSQTEGKLVHQYVADRRNTSFCCTAFAYDGKSIVATEDDGYIWRWQFIEKSVINKFDGTSAIVTDDNGEEDVEVENEDE